MIGPSSTWPRPRCRASRKKEATPVVGTDRGERGTIIIIIIDVENPPNCPTLGFRLDGNSLRLEHHFSSLFLLSIVSAMIAQRVGTTALRRGTPQLELDPSIHFFPSPRKKLSTIATPNEHTIANSLSFSLYNSSREAQCLLHRQHSQSRSRLLAPLLCRADKVRRRPKPPNSPVDTSYCHSPKYAINIP